MKKLSNCIVATINCNYKENVNFLLKTYYVRVRTYKTVKVGKKSVKIYSGWSAAKKVKTK